MGVLLFAGQTLAGPFGSFSDTGISPDNVSAWATGVSNYLPTAGVDAGASVATHAVGESDGNVVSLGELSQADVQAVAASGSIAISFSGDIFDGPGADFAVFENAGTFFDDPFIFAELAFVEVSSNGSDFARFPATSLNTEGIGNLKTDIFAGFGRSFAGINTTNVNNLAGIHPTNTGTPFDLSELANHSLVISGRSDLDAVRYVRLVDIPGTGDVVDNQGNPILDAWQTVGSGGFDLDAVGAINFVPEPPSSALISLAWLTFGWTHRLRSTTY